MPLIASAIFLASPVFANNNPNTFHKQTMMGSPTGKHAMGGHKSVAGTVVSVNGNIITVASVENVTYTIDAGSATIMKASTEPHNNPIIVLITDIHVGDTVMVRGIVSNSEITANDIFDGTLTGKHHTKSAKMHGLKNL